VAAVAAGELEPSARTGVRAELEEDEDGTDGRGRAGFGVTAGGAGSVTGGGLGTVTDGVGMVGVGTGTVGTVTVGTDTVGTETVGSETVVGTVSAGLE
jgi:hypothetical protein